ncbi:MAG TPA: hypothetical protein DCM87_12290 [Planctomycetes bacterium]|nr:hypothetical protein [Planctomycetota bacterium]
MSSLLAAGSVKLLTMALPSGSGLTSETTRCWLRQTSMPSAQVSDTLPSAGSAGMVFPVATSTHWSPSWWSLQPLPYM